MCLASVEVCRRGTGDSSGSVASAVKVDEGNVCDWAIALNWADDTIWRSCVVWVLIWLVALLKRY